MHDEMFVDSLRNRVRAMNTLWERAVSDLTLEQINHHERAGVLPMAFSFSHFMRNQDQVISGPLLGEMPLWEREGWAAKIGVSVDKFGRVETVGEMEQLTFADLDAWKEFQAKVIARTASAMERLTAPMLAEVVVAALPEAMANIYCAIVIGGVGKPVRKLEVVECFVYQHGLRHMGEIEHGRALVGLGGMTS
jgi:hypothetical protein